VLSISSSDCMCEFRTAFIKGSLAVISQVLSYFWNRERRFFLVFPYYFQKLSQFIGTPSPFLMGTFFFVFFCYGPLGVRKKASKGTKGGISQAKSYFMDRGRRLFVASKNSFQSLSQFIGTHGFSSARVVLSVSGSNGP